MIFGDFQEKAREYWIYNPKLPSAWGNYLFNREYTCLISHLAGGYSFYRDPRDFRINRYRFNNIPADRPGRYLYIKENGEYWSPMIVPLIKDRSAYKCRHGLGYTVIEGRYRDLRVEVTYFVPLTDSLEIWWVELENQTAEFRDLSLYAYLEFAFWNALEDLNIQWVPNIVMADYEEGIIYNKYLERHPVVGAPDPYYQGDRPGYAFFTVNNQVNSYEMDRDVFIGYYNSEDNPDGLEKERLTNSEMKGGNACGALQTNIRLQPGEKRKVAVLTGFCTTKDDGRRMAEKYRNNQKIAESLEEVKVYWQEYLEKFQVETPDRNTNIFFNCWNQYQSKVTFDWSRYASFWETGIGRGVGYRDTCQDTHGVIHTIPDEAAKKIEMLLNYQLSSGAVYHIFFPHTGERKMPEFSDDPLKIIPLVCHYIRETGKGEFLQQIIPYGDGKGEGTVFEHLWRALDFIYINRGKHGIPLVLDADWNDTLLLTGPNRAAESIFVGALYCWATNELVDLLQSLPEHAAYAEKIRVLQERKDQIAGAVNEFGWDGKWYLRAFNDNGRPVGSARSSEGRIFLNPQSWCIIAGIADQERARVCIDSVKEHLFCPYGVKLLSPSYSKYNKEIGLITRYNLGTKENGGVFTQSNAWLMMALATLGRGDDLFEVFRRINPVNRNDRAEIFRIEPYVYAQSIVSDENKVCPGRASNSWLTGTAGASMVALGEYLFGVKPLYSGLKINPCLPGDWEQVKIRRIFRGNVYNITILNQSKTGAGVKALQFNGETLSTEFIPASKAGAINEVIVKV